MIKRNLFTRFSVLLASVLSLYSCEFISNEDNSTKEQEGNATAGIDFPATEKDDNSTITYQFSDAVELLSDHAQKNYLVKVVQDSILFFLRETPDSIIPKVGEILSSRISDKLPYGLGNKVISRKEEDGLIKCVTSTAPLDEIFDDLKIVSEFSIVDMITDEREFYDDEGNRYEVNVRDLYEVFPDYNIARTRGSIGSEKVLEIPFKVKNNYGAFVEYKLYLGAILTFDTNLTTGMFEYSLQPFVGVSGELGFISDKKMSDIDITKDVKQLLNLINKKQLISGIVQVGPVMLRPFIDFSAAVVGEVEGQVSIGFKQFINFKCGWTQNGWFFKGNTSNDNLSNIINTITIKGKAKVGPQITLHMGLGLYTKNLAIMINTSPRLLFGAELGLEAEKQNGKWNIATKSPDLTMDGEVQVDGEIYADLILKKFIAKTPEAKINLFNLSTPLFPNLDKESVSVKKHGGVQTRAPFNTRRDQTSVTFDASYRLTGGAMTKKMEGKPAIIIEKDGKEVSRVISTQDAFITDQTYVSIELSGLEEDVNYTAYPCIIIDGDVYHWEPRSFSSASEEVNFCPDGNHPHMIDLGLPSGTKWACCDLGAPNATNHGGFYAFGETKQKSKYVRENYQYITYHDGFDPEYPGIITWDQTNDIYYSIDLNGRNISGTEYDAAKVIWGGSWQMPTTEQFKELLDNCKAKKITRKFYNRDWEIEEIELGVQIIGSNENSIFFLTNPIGLVKYPEGAGPSYWSATKSLNSPSSISDNVIIYLEDENMKYRIDTQFGAWVGSLIRPVSTK